MAHPSGPRQEAQPPEMKIPAVMPGASLTALMERPEAPPAFGIAVIDDFGVAWSRVAGGAPDLIFQAGSISKPVAALVALELVARAELDLDA
jgi:CubicO group peptidase (beta-lactamase class C family)